MANYKRGKCRYNGKHRSCSESFYRKRHGLEPIKIPRFESPEGVKRFSGEWRECYLAHNQMVRRAWPDEFNMMSNCPRAWDILFHNRPRRHRERMMERKIIKGSVDPDEALFPVEKKPYIYYW